MIIIRDEVGNKFEFADRFAFAEKLRENWDIYRTYFPKLPLHARSASTLRSYLIKTVHGPGQNGYGEAVWFRSLAIVVSADEQESIVKTKPYRKPHVGAAGHLRADQLDAIAREMARARGEVAVAAESTEVKPEDKHEYPWVNADTTSNDTPSPTWYYGTMEDFLSADGGFSKDGLTYRLDVQRARLLRSSLVAESNYKIEAADIKGEVAQTLFGILIGEK